ncbi:MAG: diaminopimelate epimerase [Planctomycetes bacterium]|nr:diaminopimelate epimerase [Planctomycetota bacterium]
MRFVKMHGAGNDYIYVDCFSQPTPADPADLARRMSDRHFGVGADGLILIEPSERADARMRMYNADGSRAQMCGNGIRCVAKYLHDYGLLEKGDAVIDKGDAALYSQALVIETDAGVLTVELHVIDGCVERARVNMGRPVLAAAKIPTTLPGEPPLDVPLTLETPMRRTLHVCCVSMGNPHAVAFVDQANDELVRGVGPLVERHKAFPQRTNVEFVEVHAPDRIALRVWERGTGETLACGTGACAAIVAAALTGRTGRRVTCRLPGGELEVEWPEDGDVYLSGPAVEVFSGEWP